MLAAKEIQKINPVNCYDELFDEFGVNIDQKVVQFVWLICFCALHSLGSCQVCTSCFIS